MAPIIRHPGNEELWQALRWSLAGLQRRWPLHIHVEGVRGTGKTSLLRAAAAFRPRIRRIKGCLYQCRPEAPHCPEHRHLSPEEIRELGEERVPAPFLEISPSAKLATVVGTLDLRELSRGIPRLLPGTLAQAHRGIVFVDEINRLADIAPEVADALLDVMGTKPGRLQVEEAGFPPVAFPVEVTVWAASNPDEEPGPLSAIRRQLADRFDLHVRVERPREASHVEAILRHRLHRLEKDLGFAPPEGEDLPWPHLEERWLKVLAQIYVEWDLESLRGLDAWLSAARLAAAADGHPKVGGDHILKAAYPALRHRVEEGRLAELAAYLSGPRAAGGGQEEEGADLTFMEPMGKEEGPAALAPDDQPGSPWHRLFSGFRKKPPFPGDATPSPMAGASLGEPSSWPVAPPKEAQSLSRWRGGRWWRPADPR
ncbi:MAG: magnesium chelatase [Clostridiales bacterium]|nr:magnesium chelatase [Clostridiales bacterium]